MAPVSRPKQLAVILDGRVAGQLNQDRSGRLSFTYEDDYRADPNATSLSLSMRPTRSVHQHRVVDPFLRGLLPENPIVLDRWAAHFRVSPDSPFALLTHVGEDVAGAVQLVLPDRVEEATSGGELVPVDEQYIASRLHGLVLDRAAWIDSNYPGQFSLAGAQSKFALHLDPDTEQWSVPSGRYATTHILKPALPNLADQDVNEHMCLVAARKLGLDAAVSLILPFGDERAMVVARYDRDYDDQGEAVRVHQEDMCQALGIAPRDKYERGDQLRPGSGPGVIRMIELMREVQRPEEALASAKHYIEALAYNWLIYGPDAHGKNYSILLEGGNVRPSPLYDISSVLPYPGSADRDGQFNLRTMAMAMEVNGKYQNNLILGDDWGALAGKLRLDRDEVLDWVADLAERTPDAFVDTAAEVRELTGDFPVIGKLVDGVASYGGKLRDQLVVPGAPLRSHTRSRVAHNRA
jgi:serine/threonine-protein kinase HipA